MPGYRGENARPAPWLTTSWSGRECGLGGFQGRDGESATSWSTDRRPRDFVKKRWVGMGGAGPVGTVREIATSWLGGTMGRPAEDLVRFLLGRATSWSRQDGRPKDLVQNSSRDRRPVGGDGRHWRAIGTNKSLQWKHREADFFSFLSPLLHSYGRRRQRKVYSLECFLRNVGCYGEERKRWFTHVRCMKNGAAYS